MKRLRAKARDIFEIPSDDSVDTPVQASKRTRLIASESKRNVLAPKDANITQRSKRKAVINDTRPPKSTSAPAKRQEAAGPRSKIPVRVKEKRSQTPTNDIRSYFRPHTPLLDQMQDCISDEHDGDYWQRAKNKKARNSKRNTRPGTPAVHHGRHQTPSPESEPGTPSRKSFSLTNLKHAGTTPRYPKVLVPPAVVPDRISTTSLRSKQSFGIGATILPDVIPEYEWSVSDSEDSDLGLVFGECVTSTPIRAFRHHDTSIDGMRSSPTR